MKTAKYIIILVLLLVLAGFLYLSFSEGDYDYNGEAAMHAPRALVKDRLVKTSEWTQWLSGAQEVEDSLTLGSIGPIISLDTDDQVLMQLDSVRNDTTLVFAIRHDTSAGLKDDQVIFILHDLTENKLMPKTKITYDITGELELFEKARAQVSGLDMNEHLEKLMRGFSDEFASYVVPLSRKHTINVNGTTEIPGQYYLYRSTAVKSTELESTATRLFGQIKEYMKKNQVPADGKPFILFERNLPPASDLIITAGVPVESRVITADNQNILSGFREPCTAVRTELKGGYQFKADAWEKTLEYAGRADMERNPDTRPYEVYHTTPEDVVNPAEQFTVLYYPVIPVITEETDL